MADSSVILDGFFDGIPLRFDVSNVSGGRKTVKHEFPGRDTQSVEDLGLTPRTYVVDIVIADLTSSGPSEDYLQYRNRVLGRIESGVTGVLIHPLYGTINSAKPTIFSLSEVIGQFGDARLSVTFEINNDTGIPKQVDLSQSNLATINDVVISSSQEGLESTYSMDLTFFENFSDAKAKNQSLINSAVESASFIGVDPDKVDEFVAFVQNYELNINSIVADPTQISQVIPELFSLVDGLFTESEEIATDSFVRTIAAMQGMFGFGNRDELLISPTTFARVQRRGNRAIINSAVNTLSLGYSYVGIAGIEFNSVREIDEIANLLEDQFQFVILGGPPAATRSALFDLRTEAQKFLDEQRVTAKQIVPIRTNLTSARLLSYQYYGTTEQAANIVELNPGVDPGFVSGQMEIFTS